MAERQTQVETISVRYFCDVIDCDKEVFASVGLSNSRGTQWNHRCVNGHEYKFDIDVKYPRIEYREALREGG